MYKSLAKIDLEFPYFFFSNFLFSCFFKFIFVFFPFSSRDGVVIYGGYGSVVEKSVFHTDAKHIFWEGDNILLNSNSDVSKDYFLISHSQNDQRKPNYNEEEGAGQV